MKNFRDKVKARDKWRKSIDTGKGTNKWFKYIYMETYNLKNHDSEKKKGEGFQKFSADIIEMLTVFYSNSII